ncbi:hypothetical protein CXB51_005374 [Gossypium anomalum]|uniref:H(+)-transporting two-sector ATPase n=1 Tax=Gossypium anomalum TaxID=47600 RepID=A0A8J5Z110_9ROSI|nr:hypothetical protein CXB51_005374 [Gossypium anomalum]
MNFRSKRLIRSIFHIHRSSSMFLLYEYDIFWAFLIISNAIPILAFLISGVLASIRKGPKKPSSYESVKIIITLSMNSIEFPLLDRTTQNLVISTTLNDLSNWSRLFSLWSLLYCTSCYFIEFTSLIGSRFDFDHYGLVQRSSPRQAYLILIARIVIMKMMLSLVRLYEQMPKPNYAIAMSAWTITGRMFNIDSYSTVQGVDKLIPVHGCPPKPEAVIDAITKLRGSITSIQEVYVLMDDLTDPTTATTFAHLDATTVLSKGLAAKGIYPMEQYETMQRVKQTLQCYKELQDIIAIFGLDELYEEDRLTIAFYLVGNIDEAIAKAMNLEMESKLNK